MRDFRYGYEPYHRLEGELPALPPVSHMELGRQEAFGFPDRRRDPFAGATNACLEFDGPAEPITVESLARAYAALVEAVGPLPQPFPLYEPLKVDTCIAMRVKL